MKFIEKIQSVFLYALLDYLTPFTVFFSEVVSFIVRGIVFYPRFSLASRVF